MESKYNIFSVPDNIDMDNPYGFYELSQNGIAKVPYSKGMTLNQSEWTWDSDERAYWVNPTKADGSNTRGFLRIKNSDLEISAGDEIEIEYDVKSIGDVASSQLCGVNVDLLDSKFLYQSVINAVPYNLSNEYQHMKIKKIVNPSLSKVEKFDVVIGTITSPDTASYSLKIRDIKITVIKNKTSTSSQNIPSQFKRFCLRKSSGVWDIRDDFSNDGATLTELSSTELRITYTSPFTGRRPVAVVSGEYVNPAHNYRPSCGLSTLDYVNLQFIKNDGTREVLANMSDGTYADIIVVGD